MLDPLSSYVAYANYGDGSPTQPASVEYFSNVPNYLLVTAGGHTYDKPGVYNVTIELRDSTTASYSAGTIVSKPITIRPTNDTPIANGETLGTYYEDGGPYLIPSSVLLANDLAGPRGESDEDAQTLTVSAVSNVIGGTASV